MIKRSITWLLFLSTFIACDSLGDESETFNENNITIGSYLTLKKDQFSMAYQLFEESGVLRTLSAYNPYGEGYTLFLPTDEAIEDYILNHEKLGSFDALLWNKIFLVNLARFHCLKKSVHTHDFPFGAFVDSTFTGERLSVGITTDGDNPLYLVNQHSPIIESNIELTNGFIHVISEILIMEERTGYEWLRDQEEYSILGDALELAGFGNKGWLNSYTILAEHDSIYHREGILSVEDLIDRYADPFTSYSNQSNPFYKFTAYHLLWGKYYINDLHYGGATYWTLGSQGVRIHAGKDIHINPGLDTFALHVSDTGDSLLIDHIGLVLERCNNPTKTGPIHAITEILDIEKLPDD